MEERTPNHRHYKSCIMPHASKIPAAVFTGRAEQRSRVKAAKIQEARTVLADLDSFEKAESTTRSARPASASRSRVTIRRPPSACHSAASVQRPASALSRRSDVSSVSRRRKTLAFVDEKMAFNRSESIARAKLSREAHTSQRELFQKQQKSLRPKSAQYSRPQPKATDWKVVQLQQRQANRKASAALTEHTSELVIFAADADDREVREDFYKFKKELDDFEWNLANPYSCEVEEEEKEEEEAPSNAMETKMAALQDRRRKSNAAEMRRLSNATIGSEVAPEELREPMPSCTRSTRLAALWQRLGVCWGAANGPLYSVVAGESDRFTVADAMARAANEQSGIVLGDQRKFSVNWARELLLCAGAALHRMLQDAADQARAVAEATAAGESNVQKASLQAQLWWLNELAPQLAASECVERTLGAVLEQLITEEKTAATVEQLCKAQNDLIAARHAPLCSPVDARLYRAQGGVLVTSKALQVSEGLAKQSVSKPQGKTNRSRSPTSPMKKVVLESRAVTKLFSKFARQTVSRGTFDEIAAANIEMDFEELSDLVGGR